MATAKERFDESVRRSNALVGFARSSSPYADEMLRFSVVLAVAAFDSYVADRFSEHFVPFLKTVPCDDRIVEFLKSISFGPKEMLDLLLEKRERPLRTAHAAVDRYLSRQSFQSEKTVNELFALYRLPTLFDHSVAKAGDESVRTRVLEMIQRRHEIAHACDLNSFGKRKHIDAETVEKWLEALKLLTTAMDEIVDNRFKEGRKTRVKHPKKDSRKRHRRIAGTKKSEKHQK